MSGALTKAEPVALEPSGGDLVSMIERMACDPNVNVDKLQQLMLMHERVRANQSREAFNAAMSEAQKEMRPIATDANNPQTKSRYASYAALDRALRPIYTKHDFGLSFNTAEGAAPEWVRVVCDVTHAAGHEKRYHVDMPADGKGAKGGDVMTKTHAVGAAMSYGMRYLLKMIFNVAVGEDDRDGNEPPVRQTPEPVGFSDWLEELKMVADSGTRELEVAWKSSKPQYRRYLTETDSAAWEAIKRHAAKGGAQ